MMTVIKLYGPLRKKFGHRLQVDVETPLEALKALMVLRPGFQQHLYQFSAPGYHIVVGHDDLMEVELGMHNLLKPGAVLRIIPAMQGAGKSPWVNIVIGVALIYLTAGTGTFAAGGWLAGATSVGTAATIGTIVGGIGLSLALGGASQLLARPPELTGPSDRAENKPSYAMDGVVNTEAQGYPIPVGYGRGLNGGARISVGISVEDYIPGQDDGIGFRIPGLGAFSVGYSTELGETGAVVSIPLTVLEGVGACTWSITGSADLTLSAFTGTSVDLIGVTTPLSYGMYECDITVSDSNTPVSQSLTKHITVEVYAIDRGGSGSPSEGL